ncbi:MAG TPA: hypothetical protein VLV83_14285 [Acidobacteriota bacterium]|nr:hypothetical protein [Acidobacteriota bacterium]
MNLRWLWTDPLFQLALFTVLFAILYALAISILLGIRDNYRRYYQKSELQWTSPRSRFRARGGHLSLLWILLAALGTAALVVFWWIPS